MNDGEWEAYAAQTRELLGGFHTPRDTVFQKENIELLLPGYHALIAALPAESKSNL